jgi:hypothetical protein
MFTVEIDGKKVDAEISFLTAQLYEAEFHKDIIQELFSMQGDTSDAIVIEGEGKDAVARLDITKIDFSKVGWLCVIQLLWAAVKTADESTPGYHAWCKGAKGIDTWDVRDVLIGEMSDCFFRSGTSEEETEQEA